MINTTLLLYCFIGGGIALLVLSFLMEVISSKLKLLNGIPKEMLEESTPAWFTLNFLMEFLFYVVIPSVGYSFFYLMLPFEGLRVGLAVALFALIMGAVPLVMVLSVRIKIPMAYLTYLLLSYFLKLIVSMTIIGYLYSL